ncbi:MAG: efflux RND transporter periplasmic adaptor subunit [Planctomycetota bacterium]
MPLRPVILARLLTVSALAALLLLPVGCPGNSWPTPVGGPGKGGTNKGAAAGNESGGAANKDGGSRGGGERAGKEGGSFGGMRGGPRQSNERPTPVEIATVHLGRIARQLRSSGRLQPRSQVTITAGIAGQLLQIGVDVGHRVSRQMTDETGAHLVLTRLDPADALRTLAAMSMPGGAPAPAPGPMPDTPAPALPPGLSGFAGSLKGKVVEQWGTGLLLTVSAVGAVWPDNRAWSPKSVVGKTVRVEVRQEPHGGDFEPSPLLSRWVAGLKAGQAVTVNVRNDLMARFDDETFVYAVREAETTVRLREQDLQQRTLSHTKAQADLDRAFRSMSGNAELNEEIFTREQLDALRLALDTAQIELDTAQLNLRQAGVVLERARRDLRACRVASPIDGVVVARHVKAYDRVAAGAPLFDVADPYDLLLFVYLTEGEASNVREGQGATIASRGQATFAYPAVIEQVAPAVDQERGLVEVRMRVAPWRDLQALGMWGRTQQLMRLIGGPAGMMPTPRFVGPGTTPPLKPGMFVAVQIATAVHERAVLCPKEALLYERDRPYVFRVTRDNRAEQVWVTLRPDFASWDDIEVESGLRPDDSVVVRQSDLKDGNPVTVIARR